MEETNKINRQSRRGLMSSFVTPNGMGRDGSQHRRARDKTRKNARRGTGRQAGRPVKV